MAPMRLIGVQGINWKQMLAKKVQPPYQPFKDDVATPLDLRNFDTKYTEQAPMLSPCGSWANEGMEKLFKEIPFTYEAPPQSPGSPTPRLARRATIGAIPTQGAP